MDIPPLHSPSITPSTPPAPAPKSSRKKSKKDNFDRKDYNDWRRWSDMRGGESHWKAMNETCKKGEIGSGTDRKPAIWMVEKGSDGVLHLYMTCVDPKCAAVNDFSKHKVEKEGRVNPCIVCVKCQRHEFVTLEGWDLGEHEETKSKADLEWEKKWKDWKPSKDGYGYGGMGGSYFD